MDLRELRRVSSFTSPHRPLGRGGEYFRQAPVDGQLGSIQQGDDDKIRLQEQLAAVEREYDALRREFHRRVEEAAQFEAATRQQLQQQAREDRRWMEGQVNRLREVHSAELAPVKSRVEELEASLAAEASRASAVKDLLAKSEQELQESRRETQQLKSELAETQRHLQHDVAAEAAVAQLRSRLGELEVEARQNAEALVATATELTEAEAKSEAAETDVKTAQERHAVDMRKMRDAVRVAQTRGKQEEKRASKLEAEYQSAMTSRQELEKQVGSLEKRLRDLGSRVSGEEPLKRRLSSLQIQNTGLVKQVDAQEELIHELRAKVMEGQEKQRQHQRLHDKWQESGRGLLERNAQLTSELAAADNARRDSEQELIELRAKLASNQASLGTEYRSELDRMSAHIVTLQRHNDRLWGVNDELTRQLEALQQPTTSGRGAAIPSDPAPGVQTDALAKLPVGDRQPTPPRASGRVSPKPAGSDFSTECTEVLHRLAEREGRNWERFGMHEDDSLEDQMDESPLHRTTVPPVALSSLVR